MAKLPALTPTTFGEAMQFSEALAKSTMVPREYQRSPANILVAIQWGAELGLSPLQAVQSIAVINGKPSVYGDALLALVRGSPLCEDVIEHIEGEGDNRVAICEARRKGSAPVIGRFSVADARRAGLWEKAGSWKQYPERMLQWRARGFALRDAFADILRGVISAEEAGDYPREMKDITPPPDPRSLTGDLDAFAGDPSNTAGDPEAEPTADDLDVDGLLVDARESALSGYDAFRRWYTEALDDEQRLALRPHVKEFQATARRSDEQRRAADQDPEERLSPPPTERRIPSEEVSPEDAAPLDASNSLAVPIRKASGGPTDWSGTKDDMLKAIAAIDDPQDAAPTGTFMRANGENLRTMHSGAKDMWSEVMRGLGERSRVLSGGEP